MNSPPSPARERRLVLPIFFVSGFLVATLFYFVLIPADRLDYYKYVVQVWRHGFGL